MRCTGVAYARASCFQRGTSYVLGHTVPFIGASSRCGLLLPRSIGLVAEAYGAHRASVRLLARVGPLMRGNGALVAEPPCAHRASVRLLAGVGPSVPGGVALAPELLRAERAIKGASLLKNFARSARRAALQR